MNTKNDDVGTPTIVVLPPVVKMIMEHKITASEGLVLARIHALTKKKGYCWARNGALADCAGLSEDRISKIVTKLKRMGVLEQLPYNGFNRQLVSHLDGTRGPEEKAGGVGVDAEGGSRRPRRGSRRGRRVHNKEGSKLGKTKQSAPKPGADGGDGNGFGLVQPTPPKTPTTEFDIEIATTLQAAVLKRNPGSTAAKGHLQKWATQIRLLRTKDGATEKRIAAAMGWYVKNMRGDFAIQAYSGAAFRAKFDGIEAQAARDVAAVVEVTPRAAAVAERLKMLGWPKGSAEDVAAATQVGMTAYRAWVVELHDHLDKLRGGDTKVDYGKEHKRLLALGEHIGRVVPPSCHYIEGWMRCVHGRVRGWGDWDGNFGPHIFKVSSKSFRDTGRGWAEAYNGMADTWDRFIEVMQHES